MICSFIVSVQNPFILGAIDGIKDNSHTLYGLILHTF